jgi:hypothetical protein
MGRSEKAVTARPPWWVVVALLGMGCVALSSGLRPWGAAIAGAVWPADLAADVAASHLFVQRISPYGPAIRVTHMELTGLPHEATLPYFPHPPFSLLVGAAMGFMSFGTAALVWFATTVALLFVLAILLSKAASTVVPNAETIGVGPLWLLLLGWPPVLYNLEKGQWSVLVAVLLAAAWLLVAAGKLRTAAIWAAVAASIKVFPVVLGVYFLLRSVRAAQWFAAVGILLAIIPLAWIGFDALPAFVHESRANLPYWESFPLVMFSIHGAIARALVGGQWAEPFVQAPVWAQVIELSLLGSLLGLTAWITWRAHRGHSDQSLAFLVWLALLPILNPLSLGHNGVLLALPLVVLACWLSVSGRNWHRWGWCVGLVLVSLPSQTVWRLAAPPVQPLEGIGIAALPMWGALVVFLVTVSLAHSTRCPQPATLHRGSGKISPSPPHPQPVLRLSLDDANWPSAGMKYVRQA